MTDIYTCTMYGAGKAHPAPAASESAYTIGYSVRWEGTELAFYLSYYLPSEFQAIPAALADLERDWPAIVAPGDVDELRTLAYAANPEARP